MTKKWKINKREIQGIRAWKEDEYICPFQRGHYAEAESGCGLCQQIFPEIILNTLSVKYVPDPYDKYNDFIKDCPCSVLGRSTVLRRFNKILKEKGFWP
jgi:hypothetical protein